MYKINEHKAYCGKDKANLNKTDKNLTRFSLGIPSWNDEKSKLQVCKNTVTKIITVLGPLKTTTYHPIQRKTHPDLSHASRDTWQTKCSLRVPLTRYPLLIWCNNSSESNMWCIQVRDASLVKRKVQVSISPRSTQHY